MKRIVVALCLTLAAGIASAASPITLDLNLASIHTEAWARNQLNQRNPGLGLTWHASRTWQLAGGLYSNSYRRPTWYALAEFTPLQFGAADGWHLDAGLAGGLASGYRRDEIQCEPLIGGALLRLTAPDGIALDVFAAPNAGADSSGFVGFQVSVPVNKGVTP